MSPVDILMVDDSPAQLLELEAVLEPLGHHLLPASSGAEALGIARRRSLAAILVDVRMPRMDGFELARRLRQLPAHATTPILFITADVDGRSTDAYAMGAVDFLRKPVAADILRAKISAFVELFRSKQQLRDKTVFLEAVLEAVADSIVACDANGILTRFNSATRQLHGLPEQPLPPEIWAQHYGLYRSDGVTPLPMEEIPLYRALQGEPVRNAEMAIVTPQGERRHLVASGAALYAHDGRKLGAVVSMHDVTSERQAAEARAAAAAEGARRKQAEAAAQQLRQSQAELGRLASQLATSDRRKTEFLAVLAHELRNPLAPIRSGLCLIEAAVDDEKLQPTLQIMHRQLDHLVRLVDDLLDVARIVNGKIELKREVVAVRSLVEAAVEASRPLLDSLQHELVWRVPENGLFVDGDPIRLVQVLSNLLNNAAKYSPLRGWISLEAFGEEGCVTIRVADRGRGIPAGALDRIFEPFEQLEASQDAAPQGLGIGLSLVKQLVELHGGQVAAASGGPDQGSVFTLTLPRVAPNVAPPAAHFPAELPDTPACRVLVVDDNVDAATTTAALLELEGHAVAIAHSGAEAIAVAVKFDPDITFLDIGLPDLSGYEVAARMRALPELARMRLVALTGWGTDRDREISRGAGFDQHLTKPASFEAITAAVRFAVGGSA